MRIEFQRVVPAAVRTVAVWTAFLVSAASAIHPSGDPYCHAGEAAQAAKGDPLIAQLEKCTFRDGTEEELLALLKQIDAKSDPKAIEYLTIILKREVIGKSFSEQVQREAVDALERLGPAGVDRIIALVSQENAIGRFSDCYNIVEILGRAGPRAKGAIPYLFHEIFTGNDDYAGNPVPRESAVQAIQAIQPDFETARPHIIDLLYSAQPTKAVFGAEFLAWYGPEARDAVGDLERGLFHPDIRVRAGCARAIFRIEPDNTALNRIALEQAFELVRPDETPPKPARAGLAIADDRLARQNSWRLTVLLNQFEGRSEEVAEWVGPWLNDPRVGVRRNAIYILIRSGIAAERYTDRIAPCVLDDDPEVAQLAVEFLASRDRADLIDQKKLLQMLDPRRSEIDYCPSAAWVLFSMEPDRFEQADSLRRLLDVAVRIARKDNWDKLDKRSDEDTWHGGMGGSGEPDPHIAFSEKLEGIILGSGRHIPDDLLEPECFETLLKSPHERLRLAAIVAVREIDDPPETLLQTLRRHCENPEPLPDVAASGIGPMSSFGSGSSGPPDDAPQKVEILHTLAHLDTNGDTFGAVFARAMNEEPPDVQEAAIESFMKIGQPSPELLQTCRPLIEKYWGDISVPAEPETGFLPQQNPSTFFGPMEGNYPSLPKDMLPLLSAMAALRRVNSPLYAEAAEKNRTDMLDQITKEAGTLPSGLLETGGFQLTRQNLPWFYGHPIDKEVFLPVLEQYLARPKVPAVSRKDAAAAIYRLDKKHPSGLPVLLDVARELEQIRPEPLQEYYYYYRHPIIPLLDLLDEIGADGPEVQSLLEELTHHPNPEVQLVAWQYLHGHRHRMPKWATWQSSPLDYLRVPIPLKPLKMPMSTGGFM